MLLIKFFPLFIVISRSTSGIDFLWKQYHNGVLSFAFWVPFLLVFGCFAYPLLKGKATGGFRCYKC